MGLASGLAVRGTTNFICSESGCLFRGPGGCVCVCVVVVCVWGSLSACPCRRQAQGKPCEQISLAVVPAPRILPPVWVSGAVLRIGASSLLRGFESQGRPGRALWQIPPDISRLPPSPPLLLRQNLRWIHTAASFPSPRGGCESRWTWLAFGKSMHYPPPFFHVYR